MTRIATGKKEPRDYVCLALDLNDEERILRHVDELSDRVGYFKLNSAFTLFGPPLVQKILDRGCKVFLDLKFHDIPNTAGWYADAVTRLGVDIVTVHTAGGIEMMRAAVKGADEAARELEVDRPKLIGITLLTSIRQETMNHELNVPGSVETEVLCKATLAAEAGLDGIVCSAAELADVRGRMPPGLFYVTPGVRPAGASHDDHARAVSYCEAIHAGSDLLVVGRAILRAADPRAAASELLEEIAKEL